MRGEPSAASSLDKAAGHAFEDDADFGTYRVMVDLAVVEEALSRAVRRRHRTTPPIPAAIRISAAASGRSSIGDHGIRFIAQTVKLPGTVAHWTSPLLLYRVGGNPSSALRVRWPQKPPLLALVKVMSSEFSTRCSCCR